MDGQAGQHGRLAVSLAGEVKSPDQDSVIHPNRLTVDKCAREIRSK